MSAASSIAIKRRSWTIDLTESPLRDVGFCANLAECKEGFPADATQIEPAGSLRDDDAYVADTIRTLDELTDEALTAVAEAAQAILASRHEAARIGSKGESGALKRVKSPETLVTVTSPCARTACRASVFIIFALISWYATGTFRKVVVLLIEVVLLIAITGPNQRT
jgi:hypothetical protein